MEGRVKGVSDCQDGHRGGRGFLWGSRDSRTARHVSISTMLLLAAPLTCCRCQCQEQHCQHALEPPYLRLRTEREACGLPMGFVCHMFFGSRGR